MGNGQWSMVNEWGNLVGAVLVLVAFVGLLIGVGIVDG